MKVRIIAMCVNFLIIKILFNNGGTYATFGGNIGEIDDLPVRKSSVFKKTRFT